MINKLNQKKLSKVTYYESEEVLFKIIMQELKKLSNKFYKKYNYI